MSSRIDGRHGIILHDKVLFELIMRHWVKVPHNFAFIHKGKLTWLDNDSVNDSDLTGLIRQQGKIILKPVDSVGGKDVKILEYKDNDYYQNDRIIDEGVLPKIFFKSGNVVISEFAHQGQFTSSLYPKTVNTVRMLTMLDPETQLPFIGAAILRIGCAQSIPVDNISAGGISCNIDLTTGRLGKGIMNMVSEKPLRRIERHPETNAPLEGQTIPNWSGICQEMLDLAAKFPILPYVAWDIALLDEGIVVIEGNRWSGLNVFQHSKPMLADERIQRFFRYHRII